MTLKKVTTAGLLLPHSGHCSSIIKQHPLPRSTWLYCSMMYSQWSPASEWNYKNTGFNLLEKPWTACFLPAWKTTPLSMSATWNNLKCLIQYWKNKRSWGNTTCCQRSTSVLTQISHSEMGLLCWHYWPYSYCYTFTNDLPRIWYMEMATFGKHEIEASSLEGSQRKELLASN